jgi:NAD-dependent dihydropyrimidine dehydrogenase PreA subunit
MPPVIKQSTCTACGICVDICPTDVFFGSKEGEIPLVAYPNQCFHDSACVIDCPEGAIKLRIPLTMMLIYK